MVLTDKLSGSWIEEKVTSFTNSCKDVECECGLLRVQYESFWLSDYLIRVQNMTPDLLPCALDL